MLRIATRGSELALWQAKYVASLLSREAELVVLSTSGDRNLDASLSDPGSQGVFVKEIQAAVLDGRADIAVHSAKDLPTSQVSGLIQGAFPVRGDVRDALVGQALEELAPGDLVATGSPRRQAQLKGMRPDLEFVPLRGNIATRLRRVEDYGAVVVAYAALERLAISGKAAQIFDPAVLVPQVGQGAIAVECRSGDTGTLSLLTEIDDVPTRLAVECERTLLARLGSGCQLPVGAHATVDSAGGTITMTAFAGNLDGSFAVRVSGSGKEPEELGGRLGDELLSRGGSRVLETLSSEQRNV